MERLPDGARLETGPGGLERLALHAAEGEALVYLQGAHVAHFQPEGAEAGALDERGRAASRPASRSAAGCRSASPGSGRRPARRTRRCTASRGSCRGRSARSRARRTAACGPSSSSPARRRRGEASRTSCRSRSPSPWPARCGWSSRSATRTPRRGTFEEALHTYFAVSDVRQVRLRGLEGVGLRRQDRGDGAASPARAARSRSRPRPTASTRGNAATVTIEDPGWRRRIVVAQVRLGHDGRVEPVGREGEGDARLRRRRVERAWSASRRRTRWTTR